MSPYLDPEDEEKWCHARSTFQSFAFIVISTSSIFSLIALLAAPSNYTIPLDNEYNATWELELEKALATKHSWIINREGENVTFEREALLKDRALKMIGMKRIDFGTTWNAYCWNDTLPSSPYFQSLLRLFEFRPLTQSFLRLTVLLTLVWRMLLLFLRFRYLLVEEKTLSKWIVFYSLLTPWIALAESFFIFRVLLQHQDADKNTKETSPISLTLFGIFAALHMVVHLLIDWISKSSLSRCVLRIVCLAVLVSAFPYSVRLQAAFLQRKTCTPYVPLLWSLPDYFVAVSVVVFHLCIVWDLPHLHLILSPLLAEFDIPSRLDYKPFIEE